MFHSASLLLMLAPLSSGYYGLTADYYSLTADYCSLSPEHQLCRPVDSSPVECGPGGRLSSGVSQQMQEEIVRSHNMLRSVVARGQERRGLGGGQPAAGDMRELVWDTELARVAQAHADKCQFDHDCRQCRAVPRWGVVGQNLYIYRQTVRRPAVDWERAVTAWYDEVKIFRPRHVKPFRFSEATGHYSQMLWSTTTHVGCGVSVYKTGRWYNILYTCNYGPGGNYIGSQMYSAGPACSQCPPGTSCSPSYPGLCSESTSGLGITYNKPVLAQPNVTDQCDFETTCQLRTAGQPWLRRENNGNHFQDVILSPGDWTRLEFPAIINRDSNRAGQVCLRFLYIKYGGGEIPLEVQARPRSSQALHVATVLPDFYHWATGEVTFNQLYSSANVFFSLNNNKMESLVYFALDNISVQSGPC